MDNPTMVSYLSTEFGKHTINNGIQRANATGKAKYNTPTSSEIKINNRSLIRERFCYPGISSDTADIILSSWRDNTRKKYEGILKRWQDFSTRRGENPIYPNINTVLVFLTKLFKENKLQYRTLASIRSALSTTIIIEGFNTLSDHPLIKRFMKGVFNLRPPKPRYNFTWDVQRIFSHFRKLGNNEALCFKTLTEKLAILLLLLSGQRCNTLTSFTMEGLKIQDNKVSFLANKLLKHNRINFNQREFCFAAIPEDIYICPVLAIRGFCNRRTNMFTESCSFFVTTVKPYRKPHPDTISRWIKNIMKAAGIDTNVFKPHSCRSASNSKAKHSGLPTDIILKRGSWSNVETFLKFYFRTIIDQQTDDESISNKYQQSLVSKS